MADEDVIVRFVFEDGLPVDPEEATAIAEALLGLGAQPGELEKAVDAHLSHVAQRRKGGEFVRFNWRRESPRGTGGRYIRRLTVEEQQAATELAQTVRQRFATQMGNHLGDLQKGRLPAAEATERGHRAIEEYYEQIFRHGMQAAGNPAVILTPRDKSALSRIVRDECDFWTGFMLDVEAGRGKVPYPDRLAMYVNAAQEAYWLGWVLGDFRPKRLIYWVLGATEHCKTCLMMARLSEKGMTPMQFLVYALRRGFLPQSGYLECKGLHCQCGLKDKE